MKIALLTSIYSIVTEQLDKITEYGEFTVVDFSENDALTNACRSLHTTHVKFNSWEQVKKELSCYDLLVSYKLNKIIPMDVISRFTFGGINIHPSMLPKYPGANPWLLMYCNIDLEAGVTIHKITEKPDAGNILTQQPFHIRLGDPLPMVMKRADNIAAQLMTDVISKRLFLSSGIEQKPAGNSSVSTITLDSLKQLSTECLWHILRGFPSLIAILYPELPHKNFTAGEYSYRATIKSKIGSIEQWNSGWFIICYNGVICLLDCSSPSELS